jgi:hypothetical protein
VIVPREVWTVWTRPLAHVEAGDLAVTEGAQAAGARCRGHGRDRPQRLGDAVGWGVQRTQDRGGFKQGHQFRGLLGREQRRGQAIGQSEAVAAAQLVVALPSGRHLQPAHRVKAGLAVMLESSQQRHGVPGQPSHRARAAKLEHQARRVGGGAAGLPKRSLLDQHHVAATELDEVICQAGACDTAANDDNLGLRWEVLHE